MKALKTRKSNKNKIREDYDIPPNGYATWGFGGAWGGEIHDLSML
jgi:hypothetical protein